jgi:hypothetical protein
MADAGHGMHAPVAESIQRQAAAAGNGHRRIRREPHRPFAEPGFDAGLAAVADVEHAEIAHLPRASGSRSGPAGIRRRLP